LVEAALNRAAARIVLLTVSTTAFVVL